MVIFPTLSLWVCNNVPRTITVNQESCVCDNLTLFCELSQHGWFSHIPLQPEVLGLVLDACVSTQACPAPVFPPLAWWPLICKEFNPSPLMIPGALKKKQLFKGQHQHFHPNQKAFFKYPLRSLCPWGFYYLWQLLKTLPPNSYSPATTSLVPQTLSVPVVHHAQHTPPEGLCVCDPREGGLVLCPCGFSIDKQASTPLWSNDE